MIFNTRLARENWASKYRFGDETELETFQRVCRAVAEVELQYGGTDSDVELWYDRFLHALVNFEEVKLEDLNRRQILSGKDTGEDIYVSKVDGKTYRAIGLNATPGGRITANAGTSYEKATPWNCFINSPVSNAEIKYTKRVPNTDEVIECLISTEQTPDNLTNIFLSLLEAAETLKSEGGYGVNFGFIRPRGTLIKGVGIRHPGVVSYMELWDKMSSMIVKGDNDGYVPKLQDYLERETTDRVEKVMPRKGAMMAILPIWHPDVEEFVRAKQERGKLTKFNISVLVDDAFMEAVEADNFYDLHFNGVVHKRIKARDLYDLIMESTYNRAEPGVMFFDNMNRNNPLIYLGPVTASNPCLAAGTKVATENGLVPVEDIRVGDKIQTTLGFSPVQEIEVHKDYPVYRVGFSDGTVLRATEGHIFHVMQDSDCRKTWDNTVRLSDLNVGDYIRKEPYRFETQNRLDLTRNDGFLAGYWLGDGCRTTLDRFIISANAEEDNSYLEEALEQAGLGYHEDHSAEGAGMHYRVQSAKALVFFEKVGLRPDSYSHEKVAPDWWVNTNPEFLEGVLDGLLSSDGNVNLSSRYASVRFKSTSLDLHELVREICLLAGADYKLYKSGEAGEVREIYGREVTRNHDVYEGHVTNDCIEAVYRFTGGLSHPTKSSALKEILRTKQLTGTKWKVKVTSIEPDGVADVYDLYEPEADDWNTHGIISRGCGEIPGTSFLDKHYKPAPYLKPYIEDCDEHLIGFTTVCLLGSLNLTQFVRPDRTFDYEKYEEAITTFTRFLDNVNDMGEVPLPAYEWAVKNIRQFGMGVNGLGSVLYMMGIKYGSEEALAFTQEIHEMKDEATLRESALLAKERGAFPMYDERYLETPYFQNVCTASEETLALVRQYGVRNAKRLTNPPLGNSSVICDMVSNGIEPVFSHGYERTIISDKWPEGLTKENVKDVLDEIEVGDATAWRGEYEGRVWYYEPHNRGLCFIDKVEDYGFSWVKNHFPEDVENEADYLVTAQNLKVAQHVSMQAKVQESCDQSVSKTASLPNDYPFEDFKDLYAKAWKAGLVGFTTYREGTMENVLSTGHAEFVPKKIGDLLGSLIEIGAVPEHAAVTADNVVIADLSMPDMFDNGPTHTIRREGNKYYMHLSYLPNDTVNPVALWIHSNHLEDGEYVTMNRAFRAVTKLLLTKGVDHDLVLDQVDKIHGDEHHVKLGKIISMALRHNIDIASVVSALSDIEGDYVATTLSAVRKFLMQYIPDGTEVQGETCEACGGDDLVYESGCSTCRSCGNSGC